MSDKERDEARERVKGWFDKPDHKFKPGRDGKDPRDEETRDDEVDPADVTPDKLGKDDE